MKFVENKGMSTKIQDFYWDLIATIAIKQS